MQPRNSSLPGWEYGPGASASFSVTPAMHNSSNFSTVLPTFVAFCFYFLKIVILMSVSWLVFHCGFDFHFPNDW